MERTGKPRGLSAAITRRDLLRGVLGGTGLIALVSACSAPAASPAPAATTAPAAPAGKKYVIKCGVVTNVDYPYHPAYEHWGKRMVEASKGAVEWQSFPNGQLGSNRDLTEGVKVGTIQLTVAGGEIQQFVPVWDVVSLPYIFRSYQHGYKAFEGQVGKVATEKIEAAGFKVLGYYNAGTRSIFTRNKAIFKPEDLKGLKIRVQQNKVHIDAFNALGCISTPLAYNELYSALQQGVVDGAENDPLAILDMKFYEPCKYFSLTKNFIEGVTRPFIMNMAFFQSLPADLQKVAVDAGKESVELERKAVTDREGKGLEDLKAKGMNVNDVDIEPFVKIIREKVFPTVEGQEKQDLIKMIVETKD